MAKVHLGMHMVYTHTHTPTHTHTQTQFHYVCLVLRDGAEGILLALSLNNGVLHLRSLSTMVIVVMFLPGKNMAGDVTLPEITKVSVPSTKLSS